MTLDKVPAGPGNTLAHIFLHRAVLGPAALLIVQQLIVASSTVWLTKLASAVAAGAPLTPWLTLYLLSLALPYLPGSWMLYQLERWSLASQDRLLSFTDAAWYGKALHWGDTGQRAQLLALYSKEAPRLVEQFTHYSYSLASCTLNALFSIVMLALVVEPRLLLAYLVSLLLVALVIKLQARHNEQLAVVAQARRLDWSDAQLGMWDNTLLGNAYNHSLWLAKTRSAFRAMTRAVLRSTWFNQAVTLLIMVATQLPMVLVLCRYLLAEPSSVAAAALVVSLPRLFQIVNASHQVLSLIALWPAQKGALNVLGRLVDPASRPAPGVRYDLLRINGRPLPAGCSTLAGVMGELKLPGRFTLTGPNGAGKTTVLLQLKLAYGEGAFYLPAKHSLSFRQDSDRGSTGERVLAQLRELLQRPAAPILLLDEWDANLDSAHRDAVDARLSELPALGIAVIDVRHQAESELH